MNTITQQQTEFDETITKLWSPQDTDYKDFPKHLLKRILDSDDRVLFGSRYTRGLVEYTYIPGKYMTDGVDYIINSGVTYDGKGLSGLDITKEEVMSYYDLPKRFTSNKFG